MGDSNDRCGDITGEQVTLSQSCAASVEATDARLDKSAAGLVIGSEQVHVHQSGVAAVVSDGETRMLQSASCVTIADKAEVTQGFVGVLAANEVEFGPDTKVLTTWREAAIFGVVFGVVAAIIDLSFRSLRRR